MSEKTIPAEETSPSATAPNSGHTTTSATTAPAQATANAQAGMSGQAQQSATSGSPALATTAQGSAVKPKKTGFAIKIAIVLAVLGTGGFFWWSYSSAREETDDAYVEGHITNISPRISGNVTEVLVDENQRVKAGQLLIKLDPRDYQVNVDQAKAALEESQHKAKSAMSMISKNSLSALGETTQADGDVDSVQADIASAEASLLQAEHQVKNCEAKVKEANAQVEFARSDFERYKTVYENRAVTKQQYDKARQTLEVTQAQYQQAEESLQETRKQALASKANVLQAMGRLKKSQGGVTSAQATVSQKAIDEEDYAGSESAVKKDQANLEQQLLQLSYTQMTAPVSGKIGKKLVEVGQRVEPGQSLLSLVQDDEWIIANFKETQVGRMKVGQPVEIKVDAFGEKKFEGTIDSLSPASGARFSMLPPDNATGNFTKVVQRIPVKIVFKKSSLGAYTDRIAQGMSCIVTVLVTKPAEHVPTAAARTSE